MDSLILFHYLTKTIDILLPIVLAAVFVVMSSNHFLRKKANERIPDCEKKCIKEKAPDVIKNNENVKDSYDVIIIGAGVVGSALSLSLARQGKRILIVEKNLDKNANKDSIIGELLQPSGVSELEKLGLSDVLALEYVTSVKGYKIHREKNILKINYPMDFKGQIKNALGFHNYLFVNKMREKMAEYPNIKCVEGKANNFVISQGKTIKGIEYTEKDTEELTKEYSDFVIVCDGCFSSFRDKKYREKIKVMGYFIGVLLEDCEELLGNPEDRYANVMMNNTFNILFYPISKSEIRVLVDFPGPKVNKKDAENILRTRVAEILPSALLPYYHKSLESNNFRIMPNQYLPSLNNNQFNGALFIGDSQNMRHPLTGAGMTVGLSHVRILATLLNDVKIGGIDKKNFRNLLQKYFSLERKESHTLNTLACALYSVITSNNEEIKDAFFDYVKKKGSCEIGPMRLLSGLSRSEMELLLHFINVIFLAVKTKLYSDFSFTSLLKCYRILREGVDIFSPLASNEEFNILIKIFCKFLRIIFYFDI